MDRWFAVPAISGGGVATVGATFPLKEGYGLLAASGDPTAFAEGSGFGSGTIFATRLWVPAGVAITSLWAAVQTGGTYTSGSPNQLGLYDDDGLQLGFTADDAALWSVSGWRGGALAGGPVGAQGAGRMVFILILATGYTGIVIPYGPAGAHASWYAVGPSVTKRRAMFVSASALPASFDPTSYGTPTSFEPMVGVS